MSFHGEIIEGLSSEEDREMCRADWDLCGRAEAIATGANVHFIRSRTHRLFGYWIIAACQKRSLSIREKRVMKEIRITLNEENIKARRR